MGNLKHFQLYKIWDIQNTQEFYFNISNNCKQIVHRDMYRIYVISLTNLAKLYSITAKSKIKD